MSMEPVSGGCGGGRGGGAAGSGFGGGPLLYSRQKPPDPLKSGAIFALAGVPSSLSGTSLADIGRQEPFHAQHTAPPPALHQQAQNRAQPVHGDAAAAREGVAAAWTQPDVATRIRSSFEALVRNSSTTPVRQPPACFTPPMSARQHGAETAQTGPSTPADASIPFVSRASDSEEVKCELSRLGSPNAAVEHVGVAASPLYSELQVSIENWSLLRTGPHVAVRGLLASAVAAGISGSAPVATDSCWWTSDAIAERYSARKLRTASGVLVKLLGPLDAQTTAQQGFSATVVRTFERGFPAIWEGLLAPEVRQPPGQAERPFSPSMTPAGTQTDGSPHANLSLPRVQSNSRDPSATVTDVHGGRPNFLSPESDTAATVKCEVDEERPSVATTAEPAEPAEPIEPAEPAAPSMHDVRITNESTPEPCQVEVLIVPREEEPLETHAREDYASESARVAAQQQDKGCEDRDTPAVMLQTKTAHARPKAASESPQIAQQVEERNHEDMDTPAARPQTRVTRATFSRASSANGAVDLGGDRQEMDRPAEKLADMRRTRAAAKLPSPSTSTADRPQASDQSPCPQVTNGAVGKRVDRQEMDRPAEKFADKRRTRAAAKLQSPSASSADRPQAPDQSPCQQRSNGAVEKGVDRPKVDRPAEKFADKRRTRAAAKLQSPSARTTDRIQEIDQSPCQQDSSRAVAPQLAASLGGQSKRGGKQPRASTPDVCGTDVLQSNASPALVPQPTAVAPQLAASLGSQQRRGGKRTRTSTPDVYAAEMPHQDASPAPVPQTTASPANMSKRAGPPCSPQVKGSPRTPPVPTLSPLSAKYGLPASRSGRTILPRLAYWCNQAVVRDKTGSVLDIREGFQNLMPGSIGAGAVNFNASSAKAGMKTRKQSLASQDATVGSSARKRKK
eukprot:jgi/Chlat1/4825/Chrsp31S04799